MYRNRFVFVFLFLLFAVLFGCSRQKPLQPTVTESPNSFPTPHYYGPSNSPQPTSTPSASPTATPTPTPSSSPAPSPSPSPGAVTCSLRRQGPVVDTDAPAPFMMTGTGPITRSFIGGEDAPLNTVFGLAPWIQGSGQYRISGRVEDAQGRSAPCALAFDSPIVGLQVKSQMPTAIEFELTLGGPMTHAFLDGVSLPLPTPPNNKITYFKPVSTPGIFEAEALVKFAPTDDTGSMGVPYCVPRPAIRAIGDVWSAIYLANTGYQVPLSSKKVMAGIKYVDCYDRGGGSCWRLQVLQREMEVQVKSSTIVRVAGAYKECPTDHVLTGTAPATSTGQVDAYCTKLATIDGVDVKLIDHTVHRVPYNATADSNTVVECPAGKLAHKMGWVLDGSRTMSEIGCATPIYKECGR